MLIYSKLSYLLIILTHKTQLFVKQISNTRYINSVDHVNDILANR